ncbi:MAG: purine-nucleoside phosphorylase [Clostridia bacterium]
MKINTPTPHNQAKLGEIAKTVLMPGDPLRAKYIAENFLEDAELYNNVRGMLGYTGKYKGVTISVQGSGMGVPSMGIYSKELFEGYDVDNIIRIGSAGSLDNDNASDICKSINLGDIIVAEDVDTDSNYIVANEYDVFPSASEKILDIAREKCRNINNVKFGTVYTSDTFYMENRLLEEMSRKPVLGVEMETLALYTNAQVANKNALALFTVTDKLLRGISVPAEQRQTGLNQMIELALEIAVELEKE